MSHHRFVTPLFSSSSVSKKKKENNNKIIKKLFSEIKMNKVADNSTHQIKKENENIPQFVSATDASLFDDSSDITFKNSLNTNNIDTLIKSPSTTSNNKNNFHCYISSYSMNKQETNDYTLNNYVNNEFDDNNDETITNSNDELDDDDDDDDEPATTSDDSQFSNLSGLSDLSGQEWKPIIKPLNWLQKQIHSGADPRELLSHIYNGSEISPDLNDLTLWKILGSILSEPPRREKLKTINTLKDVLYLLKNSKNIIILTGAGVSVSCGIPDFRSNDGIYSRLAKDFPDLPDPQAMFDINYFSKDPRPFYKFAREIYPGQFKPSPCHRFIKLLELKNKLLRNYTQNIDTLEKIANINNVIECHGSFATASCTKCKYKQSAESIRKDIFAQKIPLCPKCQPNINESPNNTNDKILFSNNNQNKKDANTELHSSNYYRDLVKNGIMKPDIVFFGEGLPDAFHTAMGNDKDKCDLLIVIGSSLKVRPVALVPSSIPPNVPQILINRERLNHLEFDVELLGDSDIIINQLCHLLGDDWDSICWNENILEESLQLKSANKPLYLGENISSSVNKSKILNLDVSSQSKKLPIITHNSSSNSSSISDNSSSSTINYIGYSDSGFDSSSSVNSGTTTPAIQLSNINSTITKTTSNNELHLSSYQKISTDHQQKSSLQEETAESNSENGFFKNSLIKSQDTLIKCDKITNSDIKNKEIVKPLDCECGDDDNDNINSTNSETNRKCHHDVNLTTAASSSSSWLKKSNLYTSAAERLLPNTYYCHKSTCSYIFEGAQVYLSSDESDIDDDDNNENNEISSSKIQEDAKIVEINSTPDIENLSNLPNFPITQNCKINTTETSTSSSNIGVKRSASYIYTDGESELLPTSFKFKKR